MTAISDRIDKLMPRRERDVLRYNLDSLVVECKTNLERILKSRIVELLDVLDRLDQEKETP